jgi:uncharacterized SAM-binding protein YcdF (DUF218 family)
MMLGAIHGLLARRFLRGLIALCGVATAAGISLAVTFGVFVWNVAHRAPPVDPHADGIVVLTGGADRIESGLQLLREGRGQRLLISGVDPRLGRNAVIRAVEGDAGVACCVDVDHARNTDGNAAETRRWAQAQGYKSLIVVTSDYHMPRSMALLNAAMPGVRLIGYPVGEATDKSAGVRPVRLLLSEFLKYVAVRMRSDEPAGRPDDLRVASRIEMSSNADP